MLMTQHSIRYYFCINKRHGKLVLVYSRRKAFPFFLSSFKIFTLRTVLLLVLKYFLHIFGLSMSQKDSATVGYSLLLQDHI